MTSEILVNPSLIIIYLEFWLGIKSISLAFSQKVTVFLKPFLNDFISLDSIPSKFKKDIEDVDFFSR